MARRKEAHGGGHGWFVTFADLMGLLVSFFVMLVAFSNQDSQKVQAVAGSMRDAFGVQKDAHFSGIVETDGLTTRHSIKNVAHIAPEDSSITPTADMGGKDSHSDAVDAESKVQSDHAFALAAASLRQGLRDTPELTEASKRIEVEETKDGLDINIVDQNGRSMFPEGSAEPYQASKVLFQKIVGLLRPLPYRIAITGHSSSSEALPGGNSQLWKLSTDRAIGVRRIFEEEGYPSQRYYEVSGRGVMDPLFPEEPTTAPNRRVTITLIHEAPIFPPDLQP
jgi:chemotaxis protein MotB